MLLSGGSSAGAATTFTQKDIPPANFVKYIQQELKRAGFYAGPVNNTVGRQLTLATENYQDTVGLPVTGVVDAVTQMRLVKSLRKGQLVGVKPDSAVAASWVKTLQTTLSQLVLPGSDGKFYGGGLTGVYGDRTVQAVMLFQACAGLTIDGLYGAATKQALSNTLLDGKPLSCERPTPRTLSSASQASIPPTNFVAYTKRELTVAGFLGGPVNNTTDKAYTVAVENYQRTAGLRATGNVDAVTQLRLIITLKKGSPSGGLPPPKSQVQASWVRTLQQDLAKLKLPSDSGGFFQGSVSAIYEARTIQAVLLYQACARLPIDGIYGAQTQQALTRTLVDARPLDCVGGPDTP